VNERERSTIPFDNQPTSMVQIILSISFYSFRERREREREREKERERREDIKEGAITAISARANAGRASSAFLDVIAL